ncbi:MAG: hypothetical protein KME12_15690 [Trichocoleus desertorum ATA4-8-CV12]|jgi:hypothetical protein|nr:hypothetical protein [Trichocoleus desertorum ATA4-8-CV12]
MPTKQQAVDFAKQFKWTGKDAERAFANVDLQNADEKALLLALVEFSGPQLAERQRLQGAQKAQVTKKTKYIKEIEIEFSQKTKEYEKTLNQERSNFVEIIRRFYNVANKFGFKDPWIETLLSHYEDYQVNASEAS